MWCVLVVDDEKGGLACLYHAVPLWDLFGVFAFGPVDAAEKFRLVCPVGALDKFGTAAGAWFFWGHDYSFR